MVLEMKNPVMKFFIDSMLKQLKKDANTEHHNKRFESGLYRSADLAHRLILSNNRCFFLGFYNDFPTVFNEINFNGGREVFDKVFQDKNGIKSIAKKGHFYCFKNQEQPVVKSIVDINHNPSLSIPVSRFCKHILRLTSSLGLDPFELAHYINFMDKFGNGLDEENLYVLSVYKHHKINLLTLKQVKQLLSQLFENLDLDQPMDLSFENFLY